MDYISEVEIELLGTIKNNLYCIRKKYKKKNRY